MSGHSELARQWVEKARNDLLCADNNLAAAKIPYDAVCFHCQQAAGSQTGDTNSSGLAEKQPARTHVTVWSHEYYKK
jgi:hypothetical protein